MPQGEVTARGAGHRFNKVFCSAVPVGYSGIDRAAWEPFARLVLEAADEATLLIAVELALRSLDQNRAVYLTLMGGGAFGNDRQWIVEKAERALTAAGGGLDVAVVSYGGPEPSIEWLLTG